MRALSVRSHALPALTALFVLAGTPALLTACSSERESAAGVPVIRWGFFRNYQPVYVGVEKGFFREAGVEVELSGNFSSGPAVVQAAGTGKVDAGHSAITGLANAAAAGVEVVGLADSQTEFNDSPLQQWFVLDSSPIRSAADLRGSRIGTNSLSGSFYYTALLALRQAGIRKEDVTFVVLPHDKQEQALRSKQIDVAGIIDPFSVQASQSGGVRQIFTGASVLGERQISVVFFTRTYVDANPDAVRSFLVGYRRAISFIQENPTEANRLMAARLGLPTSLVVPHRYTERAAVRLADGDFWLATMRSGGELENAKNLTATNFLTDRFNE
jgi:ABC-type nitrate/sulfonate/bicarbonate transport system substrate-binding protein